MWANSTIHCLLFIFLIFFDENGASRNFTKCNDIIQLIIFLCTANLPAHFHNKMDFVDIAWPWGLVAIGVIGFNQSQGLPGRVIAVGYLQSQFSMRVSQT